jgi:hypothetical protein
MSRKRWNEKCFGWNVEIKIQDKAQRTFSLLLLLLLPSSHTTVIKQRVVVACYSVISPVVAATL